MNAIATFRAVTAMIIVWSLLPAVSGCSAMLLGNGETGSVAPEVDERSAAKSATDQAIVRAVSSTLSRDGAVGRFGIAVSANNGTITLSGTVGSFDARDHAVEIARKVEGVVAVNNQIRVDTRQ